MTVDTILQDDDQEAKSDIDEFAYALGLGTPNAGSPQNQEPGLPHRNHSINAPVAQTVNEKSVPRQTNMRQILILLHGRQLASWKNEGELHASPSPPPYSLDASDVSLPFVSVSG